MEAREVFLNEAGRLRSGWRFAVFVALYLFIMELDRQLVLVIVSLAPPSLATALAGSWGFLVQAVALLFVPAVLAGWICCRLLEDLPPRSLGWSFQRGWFKDFLAGSLVGGATLLLASGLVTLGGGFKFSLGGAALAGSLAQTLVVSGLVFIVAAAGEEAVFRGYPVQTMTRSKLAWVAIIITSLIFSWGHTNNPNAVPGFTFLNTALAGVWLCVAYLRTRNLWFPLGIHWAWNWMMGAVLGLPVSGIEELTPHPLLRAADLGPAWLTGGSYGIEGGVACFIAILLSTLFLWRTKLVSATEEMMKLSDRENPHPRYQLLPKENVPELERTRVGPDGWPAVKERLTKSDSISQIK